MAEKDLKPQQNLNIEDNISINLGGGSDSLSGWEEEAKAVIKDVKNHVELISVADNPKVRSKIGTFVVFPRPILTFTYSVT